MTGIFIQLKDEYARIKDAMKKEQEIKNNNGKNDPNKGIQNDKNLNF